MSYGINIPTDGEQLERFPTETMPDEETEDITPTVNQNLRSDVGAIRSVSQRVGSKCGISMVFFHSKLFASHRSLLGEELIVHDDNSGYCNNNDDCAVGVECCRDGKCINTQSRECVKVQNAALTVRREALVIVTATMTVLWESNAVVFTVARKDSQTRLEGAWRTVLENHVEPLLTVVIKSSLYYLLLLAYLRPYFGVINESEQQNKQNPVSPNPGPRNNDGYANPRYSPTDEACEDPDAPLIV
ncbi:Hypothetical predicted protein, partial [Paramuricea clavata]